MKTLSSYLPARLLAGISLLTLTGNAFALQSQPTPIPEPSIIGLIGLGAVAIFLVKRKRN